MSASGDFIAAIYSGVSLVEGSSHAGMIVDKARLVANADKQHMNIYDNISSPNYIWKEN